MFFSKKTSMTMHFSVFNIHLRRSYLHFTKRNFWCKWLITERKEHELRISLNDITSSFQPWWDLLIFYNLRLDLSVRQVQKFIILTILHICIELNWGTYIIHQAICVLLWINVQTSKFQILLVRFILQIPSSSFFTKG